MISDRALSKWFDAQPDRKYTCADCGKVGPKHYVQPQHPDYANGQHGIARCGECISEINRRWREKRKAQLAAMPRCEVSGCRRRATYTVAGSIGMCGQHLKRAEVNASRFGIFGLTIRYDRESVLSLAEQA